MFSDPTFTLITDLKKIQKKDNVVDVHELVDRYGIYVSHMTTNMFCLSKSQSVVFSFMNCHRVCNKSNMPDATCGAGPSYPYGTSWV